MEPESDIHNKIENSIVYRSNAQPERTIFLEGSGIFDKEIINLLPNGSDKTTYLTSTRMPRAAYENMVLTIAAQLLTLPLETPLPASLLTLKNGVRNSQDN